MNLRPGHGGAPDGPRRLGGPTEILDALAQEVQENMGNLWVADVGLRERVEVVSLAIGSRAGVFVTTDVIEDEVRKYAATLYDQTGGTEVAILDCVGSCITSSTCSTVPAPPS